MGLQSLKEIGTIPLLVLWVGFVFVGAEECLDEEGAP